MASSYTPTTFAAAVLKRVGAPVNRANLQAVVGWEKAEGGHWANNARFNPLNTTKTEPGAGNTGSQGNIKVYNSWDQGLAATVATLKNGLYPNILGALKKGTNPNAVGAAITASPWGTGGLAAQVIAQTKIPGSVATRLAAQQGGLAPAATARPSTPLASAASVSTPPTTRTVTSSRTVEPDTSAQGFIAQLASQMQQPTAPQAQGGLNPGYSKYLSQAPVPQGGGGATTPDPIGSQLAGLSQLVGPSNFTTSKTVVTPGKVAKAPVASAASAPAPSADSKLLPADHSQLFELIHNTGTGPGFGVKNGKIVNGSQVFSGVWDGHKDHVHVAAGPNTIVDVGKIAQQMGLHVGENPHFGGVTPVHVNGSYHYKGEAIDVSGDPKLMNTFARRVEEMFGLVGGGGGATTASTARVKGAKGGSPVADSTGIVQGPHQTDGLPGFPAIDYGAKAGTPVVAPVTGTVYKLSGHDPSNGPYGPAKVFGWSVYIRGTDGREYYLTHLGSSQARVGEKLTQGQQIGTVANFQKYGTPDHIHMGIHG